VRGWQDQVPPAGRCNRCRATDRIGFTIEPTEDGTVVVVCNRCVGPRPVLIVQGALFELEAS
jgi:hypothetical protein